MDRMTAKDGSSQDREGSAPVLVPESSHPVGSKAKLLHATALTSPTLWYAKRIEYCCLACISRLQYMSFGVIVLGAFIDTRLKRWSVRYAIPRSPFHGFRCDFFPVVVLYERAEAR